MAKLGYDDDDLQDYANDDYYSDEEEISPEDEAELSRLVPSVSDKLKVYKHSVKPEEIKHVLWLQYMDVDATVKALVAKHKLKKDKSKTGNQACAAFAKPSPDSVVLEAQQKAFGGAAVVNDMKKLNISGATTKSGKKTTTKPSNVAQEMAKKAEKPTVSFVVIGHVDAGKSTLMGRLLYDVGAVDDKTVETLRRESQKMGKGSFALAWVLDQTADERAHGVTVDICMSSFETPKTRFNIVDAPGHRDFVPNMIAGVSQADVAVLVVDAAPNGFESGFDLDGQTKEHTVLVRSLGINRLIVAVNKLDVVESPAERFREIRDRLGGFLSTVGFTASDITFVPVAGLTGFNVVKSADPDTNIAEWYTGGTLLQCLEQTGRINRRYDSPFRLDVFDVFVKEHRGTVLMQGRVASGIIAIGDAVVVSPSGKSGIVAEIAVDDKPCRVAASGEIAVVSVKGMTAEDVAEMSAGDILCSADHLVPSLSSFTCQLAVFSIKRPLLPGTPLMVHRGRVNIPGKISRIEASLNKETGEELKRTPRHLSSGVCARVVIDLGDRKMPVEAAGVSDLGRIVLRKDGVSVAAGLVL